MLKSISVHSYYRIFTLLCASDKLYIIATKPVNLFVYFYANLLTFIITVRWYFNTQ